MCSSSREQVVEVFDALEADLKRALDLRCDALTAPERLALLQRCGTYPSPLAGHRAPDRRA